MDNRRQKITENLTILVRFDSPQVKWYMKSSAKIIVSKFSHQLLKDLRPKILENSEIVINPKNRWRQSLLHSLSYGKKILVLMGKIYIKRYQCFSSVPVLLNCFCYCLFKSFSFIFSLNLGSPGKISCCMAQG